MLMTITREDGEAVDVQVDVSLLDLKKKVHQATLVKAVQEALESFVDEEANEEMEEDAS